MRLEKEARKAVQCNFEQERGFKSITIVGSLVPYSPRFFNHFKPLGSEPCLPQKLGLCGSMRTLLMVLAGAAVLPLLYAAVITVGGGAPTPQITFLFQSAFYRNNFSNIAILPPVSSVRSLGTSGLQQTFETTAKDPNILVALVMPSQNAPASNASVLQVTADIYAYYNGLGTGTVGTPTTDTLTCPGNAPAPCTYQIFSNNYALFAYSAQLVNGNSCYSSALTNQPVTSCFSVKDPEFTKWQSLGGLTGPVGFPIDISKTITASTGTTATQQLFSGGAFYGITSGTNNGAYHAVAGPIYTTYAANLAAAGSLGLPTSDEIIIPGGIHQQTFEQGAIQYTPGSTPVVLLPVSSVRIVGPENFTTGAQLNLNDTAQLNVQVFTATGAIVTGRAVTWAVSNSAILSLMRLTGPPLPSKRSAAATRLLRQLSMASPARPFL